MTVLTGYADAAGTKQELSSEELGKQGVEFAAFIDAFDLMLFAANESICRIVN